MIRLIQPLDNKSDFNQLTDLLFKCLDDAESFRFLSYSLIRYDKKTIESQTEAHKGNGIDYIVNEINDLFSGVLAYKKIDFKDLNYFYWLLTKTIKKRIWTKPYK